MFRGYLNQDERYRKCFCGDLYLTGDLVKRDADGYFWFVGRADDVIKSAGHLIGPFEVESALMEHPAVAEAGVIGKPDPVVGETVKAFVSLKAGFVASDDLRMELLGHARKRLGAAVAPKEIAFLADAAAHAQRQDHAAAAEGARDGLARGRHVDAGGGRMSGNEQGRPEGECRCAARRRPEGARDAFTRRASALALLPDMLRIRRFEERCAELYGAAKIRGFLHLYIGEEAVAVGAVHALGRRRRDRRDLSRARPRAGARRVRRTRSWPRCTASAKAAAAGAAGRCTCSTPATRFYGGNAIVGGGLPIAVGLALADRMQGTQRVTAASSATARSPKAPSTSR